jgi:phosphoribosylformylglycinamidine synthase
MAGSRLPVALAHGEGRAEFVSDSERLALADAGRIALRLVEPQRYPGNPSGTPDGITGVCNADGRITILMPHPERTVHGSTGSWWPQTWDRHTPWLELFVNARRWVG